MTTTRDPDTPPTSDELSPAERSLLEAAATGKVIDLRTGDPDVDNLANAANWGPDRKVRADFLAGLLTGDMLPGSARLRSIKLCGAQITGTLDLEGRKLLCALSMRDCYFDGPVNLNESEVSSIRLPGCHVPEIRADQLKATGDIFLNRDFHARHVSIRRARIGGRLILAGATISNPGGPALSADNITVEEDVGCHDGFTAHGEIRFPGAFIGGQLVFRNASLANEHGPALNAENLTVKQDIICDSGFTAVGEVRLIRAHIDWSAVFTGAVLANKAGPALNAENLMVEQDMLCDSGFVANGEVRMLNARIGGKFTLEDANLTNNDGPALNAGDLTVDQHMLCDDLTVNGEVWLSGARIGTQLTFRDSKIINENAAAISAYWLTVGKSMLCDGLAAHGEFSLPGARIGGELSLSRVTIANPAHTALNANRLTIGGAMVCDKGFTVNGEVQMILAHVGGQLIFDQATINSEQDRHALSAEGLIVDQGMICNKLTARGETNMVRAHIGTLTLENASLINPGGVSLNLGEATIDALVMPRKPPEGEVALGDAKIGIYGDFKNGWPKVIDLEGFSYDRMTNRNVSTDDRLQWLQRHPGRFTPGIYDQLADLYRRAGDDRSARKILVEKQWRRRKPYNPLNWVWRYTVGYGYRTWQSFIWAAALTVAGSLVFSSAYPGHVAALHANPPRFQPVIYTLDILLPIGGLGEKSAWQPTTPGRMDWQWILSIAGWVLSAAVVAGLSGILKRD